MFPLPWPPLLPFLVSSNPDVSSERGQIGGWLPRLDTCPSIVQVQHRAGSWLGSRWLLSWWSPHYHFQDILSALGQRRSGWAFYILKNLICFCLLIYYFILSPTISRTFSLEEKNSVWVWPCCFITSPSGPCWMSAPAPSALTWRDKYIRYRMYFPLALKYRHVTRLYSSLLWKQRFNSDGCGNQCWDQYQSWPVWHGLTSASPDLISALSLSSQAAKDQGVTLLTITHRPTLAKFHTHLLQFDGQGGWNFSSFSSEVFTTLDEEKCQIEKSLSEVTFICICCTLHSFVIIIPSRFRKWRKGWKKSRLWSNKGTFTNRQ